MPRKSRKNAVRANHAVAINDKTQQRALQAIAFGQEWQRFEDDIEVRIADYSEDEPIKQSTRRALGMIREMMFEKI
ncbi:MAG: hypothetical protein KDB07_07890 [Planctomycetes bacterium]|nr:hypothetical protein [Planctomycetota bacterium]